MSLRYYMSGPQVASTSTTEASTTASSATPTAAAAGTVAGTETGAVPATATATVAFALAAVAAWCANVQCRRSFCDEDKDDDDDDDDDFDFNFAKPPVEPAPIRLNCSVQLMPGSEAGSRPTAEVVVESTFSLPVERGWPRDNLLPQDVAISMRDILADRLPRWAADHWNLELQKAPPALRSGIASWSPELPEAEMRWLPPPFPALLTLVRRTASGDAKKCWDGFRLRGFLCAGSDTAELQVACEA